MNAHPGARLGRYEVAEVLGEGGMGTVYRAHDSRLGRDVAIKVVRPVLADDPDRVARFEREARLLASLTHPHIATIHGLEEAEGTRFLVLELVPGVTLAERLAEGPLSLRDALTFALQTASAMESAHDRGIIHRDLKPSNIKITPAGAVKVLDFGLAKALAIDSTAQALAQSPTLTSGRTADGVILGTAAYMSPEQARGKELDKRTDVWAFGCVLYDMLTGRPAFASDTLSDTIAAILTRDPDWSLLPPTLPPPIRRLLQRCLQKDVHRRLRDMGDARLEIEEALASVTDSSSGLVRPSDVGPAGSTGTTPSRQVTATSGGALLLGALLLGAILGGGVVWMLEPAPDTEARAAVQFALPLASNERLTGLDFPAIAISPGETHVVYVASRGGRQQLFVRPLAALDSRPLTGTEGAQSPFFSPDGQWIAFFASGKLKRVPVGGGPVQTIADAPIGFGGAWAADETIVFAPDNASELWRVSAAGGAAEAVTTLNTDQGEFSHRWPEMLPDGRTVVFTVGTEGSWDDAVIAAQTLGSRERRILVQGGTSPRALPNGYLLFSRKGVIHAIAFDPRGQRIGGSAAPALESVMQSIDGAAQMSVTPTGSIVFVPGSTGDEGRTLVWVDRESIVQPLAAPPRAYQAPRLSPDGRTLALAIAGAPDQIWTYDIPGNRLTQLTFEGGSAPTWSHDGRRIVFSASRGGPPDLFAKAADGSGAEQRLTRSPRSHVPHSTAPDGDLAFVDFDAAGRDVAVLGADLTVRPLLATPANESAPAFSPDGRWIAYVSDQSGRNEVYVAPAGDPARRTAVSSDGGSEPVWRRDGAELFYRSGSRMMAAAIRTAPSLSIQPPRQLFDLAFETGSGGRPGYDVSTDGMRFLMVRPAETTRSDRELRVFLGWGSELRRER